jgi:hypothetical protein
MALLSPAFVQGLAAAGYGQDFANKLAAQQQQLQAGAFEFQQAKEKQQASNLWAKAIAAKLAETSQGPAVTTPMAPQPGQPQVAGAPGAAALTAAAAPATATPAAAAPVTTPQGAATAQTQQTQAAIQTLLDKLQSGQTPTQDDIAALTSAVSAQPQAPQAPPPAQTLSPVDILNQIEADNKDLPPGVLTSIIDDHMMPMMSDETKRQLEQARLHLDYDKMSMEQQDKVNGLLFRIQEAMIKQNDWTLSREDRKQQQAFMDSMKSDLVQSLVSMRETQQQLLNMDIANKQADTALKVAQTQEAQTKIAAAQNAAATGGKKVEAIRGELNTLKSTTQDALKQIHDDPRVVGAIGDVNRIWQAGQGWLVPGSSTSASQFRQTILSLQDRVSKLTMRGYLSKERAQRLNDEIQGLGLLDNPETARASLTRLYNDLNDMSNDLPGAAAAKPNATQTDPNTNKPLSESTDMDKPVGTISQSEWDVLPDAKKVVLKKLAAGTIDAKEATAELNKIDGFK